MTGPKTRVDPGAPVEAPHAEEGFVSRWSRRKRAVQNAQPSTVADAEAEPSANAAAVRELTDKDMPPIESLTKDSDYSGFLSPGVSEELRGMALRKLFHLPEFNTRCPLDSEYYDCANMTPLGSIITHEMRAAMEREAEKLAEAASDAVLGGDKIAGTKPDSQT